MGLKVNGWNGEGVWGVSGQFLSRREVYISYLSLILLKKQFRIFDTLLFELPRNHESLPSKLKRIEVQMNQTIEGHPASLVAEK